VTRRYRLLFGPLAGTILGFGIVGLALLIPGYSHVHQTGSEIGAPVSAKMAEFSYTKFCSRSHDAVIWVYHPSSKMMEMHKHVKRLTVVF